MSDCCTSDGSCHASESKTVYRVNGEALDKLIAKTFDEAGYDFAGRVDG